MSNYLDSYLTEDIVPLSTNCELVRNMLNKFIIYEPNKNDWPK